MPQPRSPADRELEAELSFHFSETVDALVAVGWSEADARAEAERRFGSRRDYRRHLASIDRTIRWRNHMRALFSLDLRDAIRSLRATPVLTAVAIVSLALGIGANAALFSIVNGLMLRPLPARDPGRLALIDESSWTNPIWEQIRNRHADLFDGALAWSNESFDFSLAGETEPIDGIYASGRLFEVLGVGAVLGRVLGPADDVRGGGPEGAVAVISHGLWQRRFGGASDVIGRQLTIQRVPVTIVGVTGRDFYGPEVGRQAHIFVPLAVEAAVRGRDSALDRRASWWLNIMIRRRPDQPLEAATAALNQRRPAIRDATMPDNYPPEAKGGYLGTDFVLTAAAGGRSTLRNRFAQPLTVILIVVGGVLLIACANLANLMLARASGRRRELSVRLALGASRGRLARQLLIEALLLAAAGSIGGLAIAKWGGALLVRQLGATVALDFSLDWRVLGFTAAVGLATSLLFGLAPAAGITGLAPNEALKEQGRSVTGDRRFGLRNFLVVAQVALSLALVVGAALFVRTFYSLVATPLGFTPDQLLIVNVDSSKTTVAPDQRLALYDRVTLAAAAVPGVRRASPSYMTPLSGRGWNARVKAADPSLPMAQQMTFLNGVAPGWLDTYGVRLLGGRDVSADDVKAGERVAVVNETFVRRFIGSAPPIGFQTELTGPGGRVDRFRVIGVTNDVIYRSVRIGVPPTMYVPLAQVESLNASFALTLQVPGDRRSALAGLKTALAGVDPNLSFAFRNYADQIAATMSQERLLAMLSGFFGGLALLLAAIGLYGVTSVLGEPPAA